MNSINSVCMTFTYCSVACCYSSNAGDYPRFLNQACAGLFLKIDPVRIVSMHACECVCVSAPKAINN